MANYKTGFAYYSVETDRYQDIRIKRLKKDKGAVGLAVYDYLLCEIYRVKGSFLVWDENIAFDVSEYFGEDEVLIHEIVDYCCYVGLFSKQKFVERSVLTSQAIQKRYLDWSKKAKRTNYMIPEDCLILPEDCSKFPEESEETRRSLRERKVKKSKEKQNKTSEEGSVEEHQDIQVVSNAGIRLPFNSDEFMNAWNKLLSLPKWKNKPISAIQMSLDMLARYDEVFSIMLIESAHSGNYMGLVFEDTDDKYQNWQKRQKAKDDMIGQKYVQSKNIRKCNW